MTEQETNKAGKGRPTPTRKEREAANLRPIVGARTPEARKAERARQAEARNAARIGMQNGEEKYLGARDRGPQRRAARDYVDSRFSFGELLFPFMIISVLLTFIDNVAIQQVVLIALYGFLALMIINGVLIGRGAKNFVESRFGTAEPGIARYAGMRSAQSRFLRMPKPQVRRGDQI